MNLLDILTTFPSRRLEETKGELSSVADVTTSLFTTSLYVN